MDWEALGEEHRAWKWAPREPGGGKQEVHGQGPRSPGMVTSDWKGAALIRQSSVCSLRPKRSQSDLGIFSK